MAILGELDEKWMADQVRECLTMTPIDSSACDDCEEMFPQKNDPYGVGLGGSTPPALRCPTAPVMTFRLGGGGDSPIQMQWGLENLSKGNYAANIGSGDYRVALPNGTGTDRKQAGMFSVIPIKAWTNSKTGNWRFSLGLSLKAVTDGHAQTVVVSEVLGYDSVADSRGAWALFAPGASAFTALYPPNATQPDQIAICEKTIPRADPLHCVENRKNGNLWASARSAHAGSGVLVSFVDRHTSFIENNVDLKVWQAICTRAGQENILAP
jgi:hypothetical protein